MNLTEFYAIVTLLWAILFVSAAFFFSAIAYLLLGAYFVFSLVIFLLLWESED